MKQQDEEFDEMLRRKTENMPYPFDEAYWVKAKNLVRADRTIKSNKWFASLIVFVFTGIVGGMGYYMQNSATVNAVIIKDSNATNTIQKESELYLALNQAAEDKFKNKLSEVKKEEKLKALATAYNSKTVEPNTVSSGVKSGRVQKPESPVLAVISSDNRPQNVTKPEPKDAIAIGDNNKKGSQPEIAATAITANPSNTTEKEEVNTSIGNIDDKSENQQQVNPLHFNSFIIESKPTQSLKLNRSFCDTCNLVRTNFHKPFDAKPKPGYLAAEGILTAFNQKTVAQSLNIGFGLRYYYFFTHAIGIVSGLDYRRINQNLAARNHYSFIYDFGSNYQTISLQTTQLDYLQVPFAFIYRLNKNHMVNAGINYLYLVQTTETVKTVQTGDNPSSSIKTEHGYFEAKKGNDLQLSLGYSLMFNNKVTLNANAYWGLCDISNNKVYKSEGYDRNKGITLGVSYKIK